MGKTLAIHWIATTRGTWLHGDPRGSWRHGRLIEADAAMEADAQARMNGSATWLDELTRPVVAAAIGEAFAQHRQRAFAATVQATHVHVVLAPLQEDVRNVIAGLKRRTTMAVRSNNPAILADALNTGQNGRSIWTAGRYCEFIFDESHLANLIEYVRDHNRRVGLPADPYEWIEPLFPAAETCGERIRRNEPSVSPRII